MTPSGRLQIPSAIWLLAACGGGFMYTLALHEMGPITILFILWLPVLGGIWGWVGGPVSWVFVHELRRILIDIGLAALEHPTKDIQSYSTALESAGLASLENQFVPNDHLAKDGPRLLAVVFTDIVRSTQSALENGTLEWIKLTMRHFDQAEKLLPEHGGQSVKTMGDGILAVFDSTTQAIEFAVAINEAPGHDRIALRVGVHRGQVGVKNRDVFGVVVNKASRMMDKAKSGGVCITAEARADFRQYANDDDSNWIRLPEQAIKGFPGKYDLWLLPRRLRSGTDAA